LRNFSFFWKFIYRFAIFFLLTSCYIEGGELGLTSTSTIDQLVSTTTSTPLQADEIVAPTLDVEDSQFSPSPTTVKQSTISTTPSIVAKITPSPISFPGFTKAPIQIIHPGTQSHLVSPIQVNTLLNSNITGAYWLELFGIDGRMLYRKVWAAPTEPALITWINETVNFEIPDSTEDARLIISLYDEFGRLEAVNSIDILCLSHGENQISSSNTIFQVISILSAKHVENKSGNLLMVSGLIRFEIQEPLRLQLITESLQVIGQRVSAVQFSENKGVGSFTTEIPYKVNEKTPVRLVVYAEGSPFSQIAHLSSIEVILVP
jgi:hypothetical protein